MALQDLVFGIPLALGCLFVVGLALGVADFDAADDVDPVDGGALDALGVGRVPLGLVAMLLSFGFGATGLILHALLAPRLGDGTALVLAMPLSAFAGFALTRAVTRLLVRALPGAESYASRARDLVGRTAQVVVSMADGTLVLTARDAGGAELRVLGRLPSTGQRPLSGGRVLLVSYDEKNRRFGVETLAES